MIGHCEALGTLSALGTLAAAAAAAADSMGLMTAALLYRVRWTASVAVPSRWDQYLELPPPNRSPKFSMEKFSPFSRRDM